MIVLRQVALPVPLCTAMSQEVARMMSIVYAKSVLWYLPCIFVSRTAIKEIGEIEEARQDEKYG